MKVTSPKKTETQPQVDLFRAKARELGADDAVGEDEIMRVLAGQKRHPKDEKPKKRKG